MTRKGMLSNASWSTVLVSVSFFCVVHRFSRCLYGRSLVGCTTSISSPTRTVPFSITLAQIPP